ncbi:MAG: malonyl-ACP O-methyltransferase BioC [Gammaproteobacteria bacterium]
MSETNGRFRLDRDQVRASFNRAADGYDAAAVLQKRVRVELVLRLDLVRLEPEVVVDAGCGTGRAVRALRRRFPKARVIALDLAERMLEKVPRSRRFALRKTSVDPVCGDVAALPLADASVDLVFCNLMLQWCDELRAVFSEMRRVLKPNGLLSLTTFGPDTLKELRASWAAVDGHTHVNRFLDMHDVGDLLVRAGFAEPVMDVVHYTLTYETVIDLMRDLKRIGAHNVTAGRPRGLTGRGRLGRLRSEYEVWRSDGRLPATYEVVFGQAWAPKGQSAIAGEVRVPVGALGKRG